MTTQVPADVKLTAVGGETRTVGQWLTTFQLVTVVLDPYTNQSAWILETAGRILNNFRGADCRVAFTVTADEADTKRFLGPWTDEFLCFADPDRALVSAAGLQTLPALLHVRQDGVVVGTAEGWDPEAWEDVLRTLGRMMSWSHVTLPAPGDPSPFAGSPAAG